MPHPSELLPPLDYAAMAPRALTEPHAVAALPGALSHLNVAYATMTGWRPLRLDLHVPTGSPGPHPVVVYAHGGSFVGGIPALGPWTSLPAQGIAVASVAYRLAGEVPFPEPVEDLRAAIRWVRASAPRFGLDPARVAGWGSSAGGYLMTMAALTGETALGREFGEHRDFSPALSAVVDHYGLTDPARLREDAHDNTEEQLRALEAIAAQFFGAVPPGSADPLRLARPGAPPFLIMHGDDDHRIGLRQSERLRDGLSAAGVPASLVVVPGADHSGPEFSSAELVGQAVRFLRGSWET